MVRSRGGRGAAVALTCVALIAGVSVVPPAAAAPAPAPAPVVRADVPEIIDGALATPPALSVAAQSVSPGRPGGQGSFEVVFASTARQTQRVKGLEVRVAAPEGTSLGRVAGVRWRCDVAGDRITATCRLRGSVDKDEDPPRITASLDIAESFGSDVARVRAWARWAGVPREYGQWVVGDQGAVPVYPRATLRVTSNAPTITAFRNGPRQSRQISLRADIGRLQGQYAALTWRQVSGPPVRFLLPRAIDGVASTAQQVAEVTRVPDRQRYVFAARVIAQGQVIERRVSVVVRGDRLLEDLDAAAPTEAAMAAATSLPALRGALRVKDRRDLRIEGPLTSASGSRVTLRALGADAERGTVSWTSGGRRIGEGSTITFTAPGRPGSALLVTARVTLPSGVVARAEHVLIATAPDAKPTTRLSPRDAEGFCRIARAIRQGQARSDTGAYSAPMGTAGVQRLRVPFDRTVIDQGTFDEAGACTAEGGIDITDAVIVQSSSVRLAGVRARLTSEGLTVSRARVTINSTLSNKLTDTIGLEVSGEFTAALAAGDLGTLVGSGAFEPVSIQGEPAVSPVAVFLSLPGGWDFPADAARIDFSDDLAVRVTQAARSPVYPQGTRGTVALSVDIVDDEPARVAATVANIALGETPRGGLITASGTGRIDLADETFALSLPVTCDGGWQSRACEIFGGLRLGNFALEWTSERISLDATAAVSVGESKAYGVTFEGAYRGADDWELKVTESAPWDLGDGIVLRALRGGIESRPSAGTAALRMSVTGTLTGLTLGDAVTVTNLTPTLTNSCPSDAADEPCRLDELKFFLTAEVEATLPGSVRPTAFTARADVNLATLDFTFTSGATDLQIGPEELRLTDVRVVISRGAPTSCVPRGAEAPQDPGVTVRFEGTARILTRDYGLNVQSDARGLCIWGSGDTIDIGGGLKAVTPRVAFTTYAGGATVDDLETIDANRLIMNGGFVFPDTMRQRFGIPGRGVTFEADISADLQEAHFTVAYNADNEVALYRGEGAALTVGQLGFGLDVRLAGTSPGFDGYFFGTGRLELEGSAGVPASSTPLEVRVGVGYAVGSSLRLHLRAGVPSGTVANAFGVQGLTLRRLSASGAIDLVAGAPAVALNADVTLPAGWGSAIGLLPGTTVALAANLEIARPCLEFRVGSDGGDPVVDMGGKGLITGNYFRLVLAPTGCEVPDGRVSERIPAGWAFAVQGALLGSPFQATSRMQIDSEGMRIDAVVEMPRLDLYGVVGFRSHEGIGGPKVTLTLDTGRGILDVTLDAAIEIGDVKSGFGVLASVKGDIRRAGDRFTVDLRGRSQTRLGPVDLVLDPITVKASIPVLGKESATNQLFVDMSTALRATLDLKAFGTYTVEGSGRLQMQDFVLTQLSLKAGGVFDAVVYKVRGTVAVDMCMGTLSEIAADGTGSQCTLYPRGSLASSSPSVRVGVTGTEQVVLKDPKPFAKVFYDREGIEK